MHLYYAVKNKVKVKINFKLCNSDLNKIESYS